MIANQISLVKFSCNNENTTEFKTQKREDLQQNYTKWGPTSQNKIKIKFSDESRDIYGGTKKIVTSFK